MSEEILVQHCSPTLAGMKTGNLFGCSFDSPAEMRSCVRCWNRTLTGKGLRILPLRFRDGRALIYVYRPSRLSADLCRRETCQILRECGYDEGSPERQIVRLVGRLAEGEEFPHEIGLFLGYPPEDVRGFMENKAGGCKCAGYWKVYGDEKAAKRLFAKYKKCTDIYCTLFAQGRSIERLAVAV